jgi:integrase
MENPRSLVLFLESCRSEVTKKHHQLVLDRFLQWANKDYESLLFLEKPELTDLLIDYALHMKKRVSPNSLPSYFAGIYKFLDMNDKEFNKRKIKALFGEPVKRAGDKALTNAEIQMMIRVASTEKQMALIDVFSANGCRPEAISELKLKHIESIGDECLSLTIYAGSTHETYVFLHKLASDSLKRYHKWRTDNGEKLTSESWVFNADTNLVTKPILKMHSTSISSIFADLMKKAGIKRQLVSKRNYDLASCGGFRKRFNTILKSNPNISYAISEKLMDHKTNMEKHYLKPSREELFEEYKKAIPQLIYDEREQAIEEKKKLQEEKDELILVNDKLKEVQKEKVSLESERQTMMDSMIDIVLEKSTEKLDELVKSKINSRLVSGKELEKLRKKYIKKQGNNQKND